MSPSQIKVIKLKVIKNTKGDLLKYLNKADKFFKNFGETYFTEIKKNKTKGWNSHKRYICLLTVPYGKAEFTFAKKINSKKKIITISKKNYSIIVVPPKTWFKFKSITKLSLVVNTINGIHDDNETLKTLIN